MNTRKRKSVRRQGAGFFQSLSAYKFSSLYRLELCNQDRSFSAG